MKFKKGDLIQENGDYRIGLIVSDPMKMRTSGGKIKFLGAMVLWTYLRGRLKGKTRRQFSPLRKKVKLLS
jgi:hypothetical protein